MSAKTIPPRSGIRLSWSGYPADGPISRSEKLIAGEAQLTGEQKMAMASMTSPKPARKTPVCRRSAFTLVELLVVISVIALLASMLLPALQKAMAITYAGSCLSNTRYVYPAVSMYTQDNNGFLCTMSSFSLTSNQWPYAVTGTTATTLTWCWFGGWDSNQNFVPGAGWLFPYWGNANICGCPAVTGTFGQNMFYTNANSYRAFYGPVDYAYSVMTSPINNSGVAWTYNTYRTYRLSDYKNPDGKALVWDSARIMATANGGFSRTPWGYPTMGTTITAATPNLTTRDPNVHGRHSMAANVLWADGHASRFVPYIFTCQWNAMAVLGGHSSGRSDQQHRRD